MLTEPMNRPIRSQRGETLIESLIAMSLLSMVAVTAFIGLQMAIKASAMHHEIAVAETLLRSAAEDLQNPDSEYIPLAGCAHGSTYQGLPTRSRFSPIQVDVRFWSPPTNPTTTPWTTSFSPLGACPSEDPGLQAIRLRLRTPSGHVQTLSITKRNQR